MTEKWKFRNNICAKEQIKLYQQRQQKRTELLIGNERVSKELAVYLLGSKSRMVYQRSIVFEMKYGQFQAALRVLMYQVDLVLRFGRSNKGMLHACNPN